MKAIYNGTVIAESDATMLIEGNHYFPPQHIKPEYFQPSDMHTVCPWKGEASYYNVVVGDEVNQDAAWYYPEPIESALQKVKKDFTGYVAFWRGVQVTP